MDWYKRNNYDLIARKNTQTMGLQYGNIASMESSGFELSISSTNIKTKDFTWATNFVYSHSHNEVTDLKTSQRAIDLVAGSGFAMEGYPVRGIFSFQYAVLTNEGLPQVINTEGQVTTSDVNFQEREPSKLVNLVYSGNADPTDVGSLGNTFKYKNLSLNVFVTYSFGNVVRLDQVFSNEYDDLVSTPKEFENRWVVPGDEAYTNVPVIASKRQNRNDTDLATAYNAYNYSTERIAKGDFIRMKEISVAYYFPMNLVNPLGLYTMSLMLQATNLFLIYSDSKLNGQDPEFFNAGGVALPMSKQFTLTLRLGI